MLERILQLMKEKKINKNELAKLCGFTKSTVYAVLRCEENLWRARIETVDTIAAALNTTIDYLVKGDELLKDRDTLDVIVGKRLDPMLLKYNQLNKNGRLRIDSYIDDLIASGNYDK